MLKILIICLKFFLICSKECFCGNNDIPSEYRVPDRECNMNCTGDDTSLLRCGGFLRAYIVETGLGSKIFLDE